MIRPTPTDKERKFMPHEFIKEGWSYYRILGTDRIVRVKIQVDRIEQYVEKNGNAVIDPETKSPLLSMDLKPIVETITLSEYEIICNSNK